MDLAAELDAMPAGLTSQYATCDTLRDLAPEHLEAIRRNLKRGVKPTTMAKRLRTLGVPISVERFREHVKEVCPRCRISLTS